MKIKLLNLQRKLKVIGSLAFNIIQFFAALIAIITTTTGAAFFAWLSHSQIWEAVFTAFLLGVFVTFCLVVFVLLRASLPRWILGGYKYIKIDSLYLVHGDDPRHHTLIVEVEIEAIKSGVSLFEDTYRWTGHGKEEKPKVLSPGHTLLGEMIKRNGWKYFYIHLGQELSKGARTTVRTVQELYDSDNKFEPFFAKVVSVPMEHIVLHVILPKTLFPSHIFFREWSTEGPAASLLKEMPGKINTHNGEIRWEIYSPIFGHRYSIDWN